MNHLENLFSIIATNPLPGSAALCKKYAISPRAVSLAFGPLIWRVKFEGNRFVEDPDGELAGVVPVIDGGYFTDLMAFIRDRIATYDNRAFCLGSDNFYLPNGPLHIFRHPISWLQAECAGIVILRPEIAQRELALVESIAAEDETHAVEIEQFLSPPKSPTKILFPKQRHAA